MAKKPAKKEIPYSFVLEELSGLKPYTKPMFGCTGVYVGEAIMLILRRKQNDEDGIWVATTQDRHEALQKELPSMRSIPMFGPGVTGWQWLPESDARFEEDAFRACALIRAKSALIGKIPKAKKPRKSTKKKA